MTTGRSSSRLPIGTYRVFPVSVDLGEVRLGSICQVPLEAPTSTTGSTECTVTVRPQGSGFSAEYDGDSLVVTVPTNLPGKHVAHVSLDGKSGDAQDVKLSALIVGDDTEWPRALSELKARQLLNEWASRHPLIPNWLFEGDLRTWDASVLRATVISQMQKVEVSDHTAATLPETPRMSCQRSELALDLTDWEEAASEAVVDGSVVTRKCNKCDASHTLPCHSCEATGHVACPTTAPCENCEGSGKALSAVGLLKLGADQLSGDQKSSWTQAFGATDKYMQKCTSCDGKGNVTCAQCNGNGERPCPDCTLGRSPCPSCAGNGHYFEYQRVMTCRALRTEVSISGDKNLTTSDREKDFRAIKLTSRDLIAGAPEAHSDLLHWIAHRSKEQSEHEVARRIWVEVLPVTGVEYSEGPSDRTAYLIGKSYEVHAPGAIRPNVARMRDTIQRFRTHRRHMRNEQ